MNGTVTATAFAGDGSGLTNLDATNVASGTLSTDHYSAVGDLGAETAIGPGAGQVAAGDHVHDARYYTETELQTSASAQVHWDNLTNVPAEIADGDADTTYSNGNGIALAGTTFSANFTASGGENGVGVTVARGDHIHDAAYVNDDSAEIDKATDFGFAASTYVANLDADSVDGAHVGTGPSNVVQLDGTSRLPAVDGSLLTNVDAETLDTLDSTAFAILAGQALGQTLSGGTGISENLILRSTANATKGSVVIGDDGSTVGVGLSDPVSQLEMTGTFAVREIAPASSTAPAPGKGLIYFDNVAKKLKVSEDGNAYIDLLAGGTGTVTSVDVGDGLVASTDPNPITGAGTVDLDLDPLGGLSKALGTGTQLGIAAGGVTRAMLAQDGAADQQILKWVDGTGWTLSADAGAGSSGWETAGNLGTTPGANYLGTGDNTAFQIHVNGAAGRVMRYEPHATSPNVVGGQSSNEATDSGATAAPHGAVIAGGGEAGFENRASDNYATIGGGRNNLAGDDNGDEATAPYATVGGGEGNWATMTHATVSGGSGNVASGSYSTVPGGADNGATGDYSFAAGRQAKANAAGTFVWADSTGVDFAVAQADTFAVRASGGVGIGTAAPTGPLHVVGGTAAAGAGAPITLAGQDAAALSVSDGGNIILSPGAGDGAGIPGRVGIGTVAPAEMLDVAGNIRSSASVQAVNDVVAGSQFISQVASGTPPLAVLSTDLVANLNADRVDGRHVAATPVADHILALDGFAKFPSSALYVGTGVTDVAAGSHTHDHSAITSPAAGDDHTQYALLAGRDGGQVLNGGALASQNLTLDSTVDATKGTVSINTGGGDVQIGPASHRVSVDGSQMRIDSAKAIFEIRETDQGLDQGLWRLVADAQIVRLEKNTAPGGDYSLSVIPFAVDPDGDVGIRTAAANNPLTVAGNADITGSLGIGTATPSAPLEVVFSNNVALDPAVVIENPDLGGQSAIDFDFGGINEARVRKARSGDLFLQTNSTDGIVLATDSVTRVRVNETGDVGVGIGVSVPGSLVDMGGALTMREMAAPALAPVGQGRIYYDTTGNRFMASEEGGAYTQLVMPAGDADGRVLKWDNTNKIWILGDDAGGGGVVGGSGAANYIPRWTDANNLGNSEVYQSGVAVGVGTTTPAAKLHVAGTALSDAVELANVGIDSFRWSLYEDGTDSLILANNGMERLQLRTDGTLVLNDTFGDLSNWWVHEEAGMGDFVLSDAGIEKLRLRKIDGRLDFYDANAMGTRWGLQENMADGDWTVTQNGMERLRIKETGELVLSDANAMGDSWWVHEEAGMGDFVLSDAGIEKLRLRKIDGGLDFYDADAMGTQWGLQENMADGDWTFTQNAMERLRIMKTGELVLNDANVMGDSWWVHEEAAMGDFVLSDAGIEKLRLRKIDGGLDFYDGDGDTSRWSIQEEMATGHWTFAHNGVEKLRIQETGELVLNDADGGLNTWWVHEDAVTGDFLVADDGVERLRLRRPDGALEFYDGDGDFNRWSIQEEAATGHFTFRHNGIERLRVEEAGVVGVSALQITDGNQALGRVLTSDALGNATWQDVAAPNAWMLAGNAATDPVNDFVGTTDPQPLNLRVGNERVMRYEPFDGVTTFSPNIVGGFSGNNVAGGVSGATISGGGSAASVNSVSGDYATIGGGQQNTAGGAHSTVAGGLANSANDSAAVVAGGEQNTAGNTFATVSGGRENSALSTYATIGGGYLNDALADYATIAGGGPADGTAATKNVIYDNYGTVGGGGHNQAGDGGDADPTGQQFATVAGGQENLASGAHSSVGGGQSNVASGGNTIVAGGQGNQATFVYATVGGGMINTASGNSATVPGGQGNTAAGDFSFAGGLQATANGNGSFVWADSTGGAFTVDGQDTFAVRAGGGVGIGTGSPTSQLDVNGDLRLRAMGAAPTLTGVESGTVYLDSNDSKMKVSLDGSEYVAFVTEGKAPAAPTGNLVAHWEMDTGAGGTAFDSVGTNDGTLGPDFAGGNAPNWIAGKVGPWALDFDGTDDYVECGTIPGSALDLTVAFWMWPLIEAARTPVDKTPVGAGGAGWAVRLGDFLTRDVKFRIGSETNNVEVVAAGAYFEKGWTHVVCTFDDTTGTAAIYVNGKAAASQSAIGRDVNDAVTQLRLGVPSLVGVAEAFWGRLDDVWVYDRALTGPEVEGLYRAAAGGGVSPSWLVRGNQGLTDGVDNLVGTNDEVPLNIIVHGERALRLAPHPTSPNVIAGFSGNSVTPGVCGATVSGGGQYAYENSVTGDHGSVSGGYSNEAGFFAAVGGGSHNTASGYGAMVPGGSNNLAQGQFSFAVGRQARANHNSAFVWADDQGTWFDSTADNQFLVRASGGVGLGVNDPGYQLDVGGAMRLREQAVVPTLTGSEKGTLYMDDPTSKLRVSLDGTSFVDILTSTGPSSVAVDPTFAAHWPFDDLVSPTADATGNGNVGTLNGTAGWGGGFTGAGSVSLDGIGGYVTTPLTVDQLATTNGVTFTAWVRPASTSAGLHHVISTDDGGADWGIARDGATWVVFDGNVQQIVGDVDPGTWQFVAATFSSTGEVRFCDNWETVVTMVTATFDVSSASVTIGRHATVASEFFDGDIDEVRVYNRALSNLELQDIFNRDLNNNIPSGGVAPTWLAGGNEGLTDGWDNFLGTTDNVPLNFIVDGQRAMRIASNGLSPTITGGHVSNTVSGQGGVIAGGGSFTVPNTVSGGWGFVGGGYGNNASGYWAAVSGGAHNDAQASYATIAGGGPTADPATTNNVVYDDYGTIGGGGYNRAGVTGDPTNQTYATVGGGRENTASATGATVAGGTGNSATSPIATVAGGESNAASGFAATVAGGSFNSTGGNYTTIAGGRVNSADGFYATIPGGEANQAHGGHSLAAGWQAQVGVGHDGTFVWADSAGGAGAPFASTGPDQFLVRAAGGVGLGVTDPGTQLDVGGAVSVRQTAAPAVAPATQGRIYFDGLKFKVSESTGAYVNLMPPPPPAAWEIGGNDNITNAATQWLGTTAVTGQPLDMYANGQRALRLEYVATSPNIVGGHAANIANSTSDPAADPHGVAISGGGEGASANRATDDYAAIGGGLGNVAGSDDSDRTNALAATVGGGQANSATDQHATVSGGAGNAAISQYATVPGGNFNLAAGASSLAAGNRAKANHAGAFVWGDSNAFDFASLAANEFSVRATGGARFVTKINTASVGETLGGVEVVYGATENVIAAIGADPMEINVGGARALRLEPNATSPNIVGGHSGNKANSAADDASPVGAFVGGGGNAANPHLATDDYTTVGGGLGNQAGRDDADPGNAARATVGGGAFNTASGYASTVGGGQMNTALANSSAIGGGYYNEIQAAYSTIAGGGPSDTGDPANTKNLVFDEYGTIGGGGGNRAGLDDANSGTTNLSTYATVAGGQGNAASGPHSAVGGGINNTASGQFAAVGGGQANTASELRSTVSGGASNVASGQHSTVPGGQANAAQGNYSFAAGWQAQVGAGHTSTFVWADSAGGAGAPFASTGADQFLVRAAGGVGLGVTDPGYQLDVGGAMRLRGLAEQPDITGNQTGVLYYSSWRDKLFLSVWDYSGNARFVPIMTEQEQAGGLEAWWRFEDGAGSTTAYNVTGTNHGTLVGALNWVGGHEGTGALEFPALAAERVVVGGYQGIGGSDPRTVAAWIKADSSAADKTIIAWGDATAGQGFVLSVTAGGSLSVSNSGAGVTGAAPIDDSQWHHVAVSCDGTSAALYVDGRPDGSGALALNTSAANDVRIGALYDDTLVFDGVIDDLRLYSRALPALEVNGIFNELSPTSGGTDGGLQLWWRLDEDAGGVARDSSLNGRDGTLGGTPLPTWNPGTGRHDGAIDLPGVDQYVASGATPSALGIDGDNARTIALWVETHTFAAGAGLFTMGENAQDKLFTLMTLGTDNNWRLDLGGGGQFVEFVVPGSLNNWTHLAVVLDNDGNLRIYADGDEVVYTEFDDVNTGDLLSFAIGNGAVYFDGRVDDVMIFDRALRESEIESTMIGQQLRSPGEGSVSPSWVLNGNDDVYDGVNNFLGTTTDTPINVIVGGQTAMRVDSDNVLIGADYSIARLNVGDEIAGGYGGEQDIALGVSAYGRLDGTSDAVDIGAGGNFEGIVHGTGTVAGVVGGLRAAVRNESDGGSIGQAIGIWVDDLENRGTSPIAATFGLKINNLTDGTQTNAPYAIYSQDSSARTFLAGATGVSVDQPQATLHVGATFETKPGRVSASVGTNTVSIEDAIFTGNVIVGDLIRIDSEVRQVVAPITDTVLTVNANWGTDHGGEGTRYAVATGGDMLRVEDAVGATPLIVDAAGNIGIGTTSPAAALDVVAGAPYGAFRMADGNEGAGKVLTSDASGNATWAASGAAPVSLPAAAAHWKLDETTGFTAGDSSGNGRDGALGGVLDFGTHSVAGALGGALDFPGGLGDYVTVTGYKGVTGSNPRTVTAWVKWAGGSTGPIVTWGLDAPGGMWEVKLRNTGVLRLSDGSGNIEGTTLINDSSWHHIAVVLPEGGTTMNDIVFYIDGNLESHSASATVIDTTAGIDVMIGEYFTPAPLTGALDDVRIYACELSQAQVQSVMAGEDHQGGGLSGSGTANMVAKFSDANTLTDSQIFDDGTNVGIGTAAPVAPLHVETPAGSTGAASYFNHNATSATPGADGTVAVMALATGDGLDLNDMLVGGSFEGATVSGAAAVVAGLRAQVRQEGDATVAQACAVSVDDPYFQSLSGGSIGELAGVYIRDIAADPAAATTVTDTYGIYIGDMTDSGGGLTQTNTPYSIYAFDQNARSYFGGAVGIGTETPSAALDVFGDVEVTGSILPGVAATYNLGSVAMPWNSIYGNVASFHVVSTDAQTTIARDWSIGMRTVADGTGVGNLRIKENNGGTEALNITPSGAVGIGTETPSAKLDVAGSVTVTGTESTIAQPAWIDISAFSNGWDNLDTSTYNGAGYFKDTLGFVNLKGVIAAGTVGQSAFTLPGAYRPSKYETLMVMSDTGAGYIGVSSTGEVIPMGVGNGWVSLDGVRFRESAPTIAQMPTFVTLAADDPDNGDAVLGNGDTLTLIFDMATNTPPASTKLEIDALLDFNGKYLGTNYTGVWISATTLVITISDATGGDLNIGDPVSVKAAANLKDTTETTPASTDSASITGDWGLAGSGTPIFINEVHYENGGTDANEAIEVAGPAGTDLTGWSIVFYNGANGTVDGTALSLSGFIDDEGDGYGALSFLRAPIQNGAPDGFALYDGTSVVQFLSYEGSFTALEGVAAGLTSEDIGVNESDSTLETESLQLVGTGMYYEELTWQAPATSSFGSLNGSETLGASAPLLTFKVVDLTTGVISDYDTLADLLTNPEYKTTKMVFRLIPAGSFMQGDEVNVDVNLDEETEHAANITQHFYAGVFEITQDQWTTVMGAWTFAFPGNPQNPAENISWDHCQTFMATVNGLGSMTGTCRLPTEAEWEYACKAGSSTNYFYGDIEDGSYMWYGNPPGPTAVVGTVLASSWGLYDVHGNVSEWVADWYRSDYYSNPVPPPDDPPGPGTGTEKVSRGGSFADTAEFCRSSDRYKAPPITAEAYTGARAMLVP
ncbi:MAG: LamG-like jellyroll fold domain-containing protein [Planctomycetota bacterium]